jgi:hypothetical protein
VGRCSVFKINSVQTKRCIKTENILYITIPVSKFDLYYVRFKNIRIGITREGDEGEREGTEGTRGAAEVNNTI